MTSSSKLSLESLMVLEAVARHGSFTRAAAEINRVPSALSYTIAQLEQRLGLRLFDRSERKIQLTPAGADLLADGRRLLRLAGDIESRLLQRVAGWESELRVAIDTIFGLQTLYALVNDFDMLNSNTRLHLQEEAVSGCWDALESGRADLVVAGLGAGGVPSGGGFQIEVIGTLDFDYCVAPFHPLSALAGRSDQPITDDELRQYRAVSVADSSHARPSRTVGLLVGQDTLTVKSMRDKLAAQIAGHGVGFLPRFLAEPAFKSSRLVRLEVMQPRPRATFCIAYRQGGLGNAGHWFLTQMAKPGFFAGLFLVE